MTSCRTNTRTPSFRTTWLRDLTLTHGSLYSGIGGFDLGFEQAGLGPLWQLENDPDCIRVLERHWPGVQRFGDIRTTDIGSIPPADIISAGFPCQPWSRVGRRSDAKNLWPQTADVLGRLRPRYIVLENAATILSHVYFGTILSDLAAIGYNAEWEVLSATAFGAPHIRHRIFVVAYPSRRRHGPPEVEVFPRRSQSQLYGRWPDEPALGRMADGVSGGVDRRRMIGNAVVPAIAKWIGQLIIEHEKGSEE